MTDGVGVVFWLLNVADNRLLYISPAVEAVYGIPPEAVHADPWGWMRLVHPDDRPALEAAIAREQAGEHSVLEYRIVRPDGEERHLRSRTHPVTEGGVVVRLTGVVEDLTELRRAEEVARRSEDRLRFALDAAGAGVWEKDFSTGRVWWSETFRRLHGVDPEVPTSAEQWLASVTPADRQRVRESWGEALRHRRTAYSARYRPLAGTADWVLDSGWVRYGPSGQPVLAGGVCVDISESRRLEMALERERALLRHVTDAVPGMVYQLRRDPEGDEFVFVSRGAFEVYGVPAEELTADAVRGLVHAQDRARLEDALARSARTGSPFTLVYRLLAADGQVRWVREDARPAAPSLDAVIWNGLVTDVTELIRTQEALRESEARFQAFMDHVPAAAWIADADGTPVYVNPRYARIQGSPPAQITGRSLDDLFGPDLARDYRRTTRQVLETGRSLLVEGRIPQPDGSLGYSLLVKFPIPAAAAGDRILVGGIGFDVTEQRRAEEELSRVNALLRAVLEHTTDSLFVKDRDGRYLLVNRAAAEVLGRPAEEVIGRTDAELLPSGNAASLRANDLRVLTTGRTETFEEVVALGGRERAFQSVKGPVRGPEGEPTALFGMSREVTESREAEARLRFQAAVLEQTHDAVVATDREGAVIFWNRGAERLYGYTRAEAVGRHISFLYPGGEGEQPSTDALSTLLERGFRDVEVPRRHKDGSLLEVHLALSVLRGPDGRAAGVIGCSTDVSERRRNADALRHSEARYRLLAENIADVITLHGPDGVYQYASPSVTRLSGYTPEDLVGRDAYDFIHSEDRDRVRIVQESNLRGLPSAVEWRMLRKDGSSVWVETTTQIIADADGRPRQFLCTTRDVTARRAAEEERRRLEARLAESQRVESLGVLSGGLAHDFNNLLTAILGHANLARDAAGGVIGGHLDAIEQAATHAADLCRQMLAFAGKGRFVFGELDPATLLRETAELLRPTISRRAILTVRTEMTLPPVRADGAQLRQLVMNLLLNASDALGDGGGVIEAVAELRQVERDFLATCRAGSDLPAGSYVCLSVADTGSGMTPEVEARIFEPFFTTKFTGRGLGLAAVLGIVRGHNGALHVESSPGHGSRFTVLLPPAVTDEAPLSLTRARPPAGAWRGEEAVLLADDEDGVRAVAASMLRSLGFEPHEAADGEAALTLHTRQPGRFRLALLDVLMPGLDGPEVCRRLREAEPDLPVILMSGYAEAETGGALEALPVAGFLRKPFRREDLADLLRTVLGPG